MAFVPALAITLVALDTQGIPASDLRKRAPMTTIFFVNDPHEAPVGTRDFVFAKEADDSLVARGRDKTGKAWRATTL
jgi:hypothetical protein